MPDNIKTSRFTRGIDRDVLQDARRRGHLLDGERIVVAISGGPDSTALLIILTRIATQLRLKLTAAHFDHQLRTPREAEDDRRYVDRLCRRLNVPLHTGRGNVQNRSRRYKETIEEAARFLRFRFLAGVAERADASAVALGHTLDDQAETVLLHLLRGSGLGGLSAMAPRARWPFGSGPDLARPLLTLRRTDTEQYCRESGLDPRQDPSNDLPIATRNRLRSEVIPLLREFNPRADEALSRLAEAAAVDHEFIERVVDRDWSALTSAWRDRVVFPREAFTSFHPAVQARLLMRAVEKVGDDAAITAEHVAAVRTALEKRMSRVSLPGGLLCTISPSRLTITRSGTTDTKRQKEQPDPAAGPQATELHVPGETPWGKWTITAKERTGRLPRQIGRNDAYLDASKIRGRLRVRSRRHGDRMRPLGMSGSRKLQDILVDAKVPENERDEIPIIEDARGIVWVAGQRLAERVAVRSEGRILHLKATRKRTRRKR